MYSTLPQCVPCTTSCTKSAILIVGSGLLSVTLIHGSQLPSVAAQVPTIRFHRLGSHNIERRQLYFLDSSVQHLYNIGRAGLMVSTSSFHKIPCQIFASIWFIAPPNCAPDIHHTVTFSWSGDLAIPDVGRQDNA